MHDLVIRGGKIVDGSGEAARSGDIAIDGDRIAAVLAHCDWLSVAGEFQASHWNEVRITIYEATATTPAADTTGPGCPT